MASQLSWQATVEMARSLRQQVPGETYHVTTHAVAGTKIVRNNSDRARFLAELATVVERYQWVCLAVSVLDNHYHLLVTITEPNLALGMQRLNGAYAAFFNRKYTRKGHLFGARYYSGPVVTPGHLLMTIRYIARNRVVVGAAADPTRDQWSSYPGVIGTAKRWPFVAATELLRYFGNGAGAVALLRDLVEGAAGERAPTDGVRPP
jgi:REP element-mobilizing transposase RayT